MNKFPIVLRRIFLLLLITGLAACAGKDKQEKTPDHVTGQLSQEILKTVTDPYVSLNSPSMTSSSGVSPCS